MYIGIKAACRHPGLADHAALICINEVYVPTYADDRLIGPIPAHRSRFGRPRADSSLLGEAAPSSSPRADSV